MKVRDLGAPGALSRLQAALGRPARESQRGEGRVFSDYLDRALDDEVKVSAHAAARLSQRGIHLGDKEMDQVRAGLDVARSKGIKSSLVVVSNAALVVNVGSRTVVTALPHRDLEDAAFTNIDGAVFVGAF